MALTADELVAALRDEDLRITKARRAICDVLADEDAQHLSAADILERARTRSGVDLDQSTVYRTLEVLQSLGYLRHVHLGHTPGIFHLTAELDHHHLVCEVCGRSVDLPLDEVQTALGPIVRSAGFSTASLHFALLGRCRACGGER